MPLSVIGTRVADIILLFLFVVSWVPAMYMTARGPSKTIFLPALLCAQVGQTAFTFSPIVAVNETWMDRTLQGWLYLTLLVIEAYAFYVLHKLIRRSMPRRCSDLFLRILAATASLQAVFAIMSTVSGIFGDRGGRVTSLWHTSSILCNIFSIFSSVIIVALFTQVLCAGLNIYPCPPFDYVTMASTLIIHLPNMSLLVLATYLIASGAPPGDALVITILNVKIVGIMLVLTEVTSTWRRLVHLREASRAENISFECRGMNEPHSPCANDIEGSERHLPDTTRPESISSDYGGADEHRRDIGSQSTLCVPLKEPPRSRSAQRGRSLDPEGNLYRHSYVTPNESSSFRELIQTPRLAAGPSSFQRLRALRNSMAQRKSRIIGLPAHPAPIKKGAEVGPPRPARAPHGGLLSPPMPEFTDVCLHRGLV